MTRDLAAGFQTVRPEEATAQLACLDAIRARGSTQTWKQRAVDLLLPRPGSRLLDVGCGTGEDAQAMAAAVLPGGKVVGVDSSEVMIDEARRRAEDSGLPVEFGVGDAVRLEFADGSFDGVHAERLLVHVPDGLATLRELVRVARAGGRIVITEPDMETWLIDGADDEITRRMLAFLRTSFVDPWAGRRLLRWFHAAGLVDIECRGDVSLWTETGVATAVMGFEQQVPRAVDAGVLTAEQGAAWLDDLAAGPSCFASATLFTCAGTVGGA